jgi:hypothetical protein
LLPDGVLVLTQTFVDPAKIMAGRNASRMIAKDLNNMVVLIESVLKTEYV